jgi:hypothetical protein
MERNWTERVDLDALAICQGHHYGTGRAYKLSVPLATDETYVENSEVYVYNHTAEDEGQLGAWGRYDSHPATGWANLNSDAFFGSTNGRVLLIRNTGLTSDYRDDNEAIEFSLETRANDFGNSGIRKVLDKVIVHYRTGAESENTSVDYSVDLEEEYESTSQFTVPRNSTATGVDDSLAKSVVSIAHSVTRRRGTHFGIKVSNDGIDESVEVVGIDFRVGGLTDKGLLKAVTTRNR